MDSPVTVSISLTVHGFYYFSITDHRDEELLHPNHVSRETPSRSLLRIRMLPLVETAGLPCRELSNTPELSLIV